jgi:hypothetical protein
MSPGAEHSKLEYWDSNGKPYLKEYLGSGKLSGKKAIITGGDSVSPISLSKDHTDFCNLVFHGRELGGLSRSSSRVKVQI